MPMVAQFARFAAREGLGPKVREALNDASDAAAAEPGTLVYAIHQSTEDSDVIWMYELYVDADAQVAHSSSEATKRLRAAVADLLREPTSVIRTNPVREFGLPSA
jgi:quinol monooxygenase YgiN